MTRPIPALPPEHRGRPTLQLGTRQELRDWLADNHKSSKGVWFVLWRSTSGRSGVTYDELVEEALCFGWIDSQAQKLDELRTLQLITPRRPGSGWSRSNKERVDRLLAAGLMTPAGLAAIEAARADGTWAAGDAADRLEVPPDLAAALDARQEARPAWEGWSASLRRGLLLRIHSAKRAETRAKRIADVVEDAAAGRRPRGL
jgi:uncharacterized protein YdeI (YjbR/CyaY-like superfamily)